MLKIIAFGLCLVLTVNADFFDGLNLRSNWYIQVNGQLKCDGNPIAGMVELYDIEIGPTFTAKDYDLLNKTVTSDDGRFELYGSEMGYVGFQPILRVFHKCHSQVARELWVTIPFWQVHTDDEPGQNYPTVIELGSA
ncbi:unnamed protein product [Bursaphelenchus xylophilus]|uniref:(pine wood nematode) hypothetical protein n=1 Tax=Bursaphelenchus xylophilus TaxID=6326 RepID=A0A1I7S654_BURXY|nr:unnamed protein product [Bursaphelenchus xylophilus]CAG9082235.1 unnamed protein product [Bursaphelenchus xylophilus]